MSNDFGDVWDPKVEVEQSAYNWIKAPIILRGYPSRSNSSPRLVDLFCGCGGFSAGFQSAGFEIVMGLDIHQPSVRTFKVNFPSANVILGDVRRTDESLIRDAVESQPDVVVAGVPCQGFSLCNRKRWDHDKRNYLFREFIRIVRLLRPQYVVLENVSTLKAAANGGFARAISRCIENCGFEVDWRILDAAEFGVPQHRRRIFFFGAPCRERLGELILAVEGRREETVPTVRDAISDLPSLRPGEASQSYASSHMSEYQRILREGYRGPLRNHEAPRHPAATVERIARTPPGQPMYPRFRQRIRLHPDEQSPTIVAGGIRPQFCFGHPWDPRGLTIRERARLQSFPDRFVFTGGVVQGRVQTGNAVPPMLAQVIGEEIARLMS
ncbi:MAG: DNA cytosine methyltransferase [Candidatus Thorarchaeota archaeon]